VGTPCLKKHRHIVLSQKRVSPSLLAQMLHVSKTKKPRSFTVSTRRLEHRVVLFFSKWRDLCKVCVDALQFVFIVLWAKLTKVMGCNKSNDAFKCRLVVRLCSDTHTHPSVT